MQLLSLFMSTSHTKKTSFTCGSEILFESKWAVLGLNKQRLADSQNYALQY